MRAWLFMLWGLVVWAVHFAGLYGLASIADLFGQPDALFWRGLGLGFSLVCLAAVGAGLAAGLRSKAREAGPSRRFVEQIAALGAGLGALAILWQTAPLLIT